MVTGARQKLTLTGFILATKEIGELAHPIAIQGRQGTKASKSTNLNCWLTEWLRRKRRSSKPNCNFYKFLWLWYIVMDEDNPPLTFLQSTTRQTLSDPCGYIYVSWKWLISLQSINIFSVSIFKMCEFLFLNMFQEQSNQMTFISSEDLETLFNIIACDIRVKYV